MPDPYRVEWADKSDFATDETGYMTALEANTVRDRLNDITQNASLRWAPGFTGPRCWANDENGRPVEYHGAASSTAEIRAATAPGTNGAIWIVTQPPGDPVTTYRTARDT